MEKVKWGRRGEECSSGRKTTQTLKMCDICVCNMGIAIAAVSTTPWSGVCRFRCVGVWIKDKQKRGTKRILSILHSNIARVDSEESMYVGCSSLHCLKKAWKLTLLCSFGITYMVYPSIHIYSHLSRWEDLLHVSWLNPLVLNPRTSKENSF